ncbi:protein ACCELERATED CELL DEATH 6-like [Neltuma alba]|uniref:protein ACCELERATED CELL DEATH 6-like n=1 Tax=Neltuma alba TaxID=207710 RepID=UPI0010A4DECC|nr:protein ACCELERATED CELL DEATH 6-like [Prosopis alba]
MKAMRLWRAGRFSPSGSKPKLVVQEHGPNTDLNLLTAAYVSTGSDVSTPNRVFIVPGDAIYKQRTPLGNTVLHLAAAHGNNAMVEKVAQQAPYLFAVTNSNYDTALHAAARAGHASTMMLLVSLTLLRNKQGNTFLHEAFMVNAHAGALIFNAFEDPFIRDNSELEAKFKKIVNNLVVFAINGKGKSLLYVAIEVGCKQVVDQLLDICIQYDLQPQGKSPLLPTLTKRNMEMKKEAYLFIRRCLWGGVSFLVKRCSSCTMERDNDGFFPIHLACSGGHVRVVEELLKYYPDPTEMLDKNGRTLLHAAAKSGKYEMVRYILLHPKLEFMINHKDNDGNTPLHLATLHCPSLAQASYSLDLHGMHCNLLVRLEVLFRPPCCFQMTQFYLVKRKNSTTPDNTKIEFAAGFAMPGDVDQGTAIMLNHVMFHLFILSLTTSIFGAIIATIILMWARLDDLNLMLFALKCAMPILGISLTALSLTFLAGVYLVVSKLSWLSTTFLVLSVVLIFMVVFLYALLLLPSSSTVPFIRYISYYPFLLLAKIAEVKIDANHKSSSTSSTL